MARMLSRPPSRDAFEHRAHLVLDERRQLHRRYGDHPLAAADPLDPGRKRLDDQRAVVGVDLQLTARLQPELVAQRLRDERSMAVFMPSGCDVRALR
jgi:hypothetical protein